ncbi:MAG: glycosyltransferase [Arcicella sp.]|nr:glycosyltransferase [Arcicella sp.]
MSKLSVLIPTYNHGKFITQTLEGVLEQLTDFDFEIVIGDDTSKNDNALIISDFAKKFPDKIKAFLHPKNLGPIEPRELGGKNNVGFLFSQCRGEYIALCEGDDYWTNNLKLQNVVDFLERNQEYALCHHQLEVIYQDGSPSHGFNPDNQRDTSTLEDLLKDETWFLGTASTVFRNVFKSGMPDWWWKTASGDLGIFVEVAKYGKIKYFPETMGCYRKHSGGMTNIHTPQNQFFLRNRMEMFESLDKYFEYNYNEILEKTINKYRNQLV